MTNCELYRCYLMLTHVNSWSVHQVIFMAYCTPKSKARGFYGRRSGDNSLESQKKIFKFTGKPKGRRSSNMDGDLR